MLRGSLQALWRALPGPQDTLLSCRPPIMLP
jgi:hypothetical protein